MSFALLHLHVVVPCLHVAGLAWLVVLGTACIELPFTPVLCMSVGSCLPLLCSALPCLALEWSGLHSHTSVSKVA